MYEQTIDAPRQVPVGHRCIRSWLALVPLLAALGFVLFETLASPLKDDIAWLLYVAQQWLAGRRLYVDLIEVNPPMIVWILALPVAVSEALGVAAKFVAVPFFAACMLGSAGWCARLMRGYGPLGAVPLQVFAAVGTVLLLLPGPEFGQREHLLVAAALPYLCLFARRLDGSQTKPIDEVAAGILAGVGCALKPQFLLAFALLEIVGRMQGLPLARRMTTSTAVTMLVYIVAILLLYPAYFTSAIPLGFALYGATDVSWPQLLGDSRPVLLADAVAFMLWWIRRDKLNDRALPLTLAVFGAGAIIVWLLEGKSWFYHRLPASIMTTLALVYWISTIRRPSIRPRRVILVALSSILGLSGIGSAGLSRWREQVEITAGSRLTTERKIEQLVRRDRARSYIAFSQWIALGFPVVNNTGVVWSSRFDSMWAFAGEVWRRRIDGQAPREWPVHRWVVEDFLAGCPDLAIVDQRDGIDYIGTLSAFDTRFKDAWSQYEQSAAFDGLRVFRRRPLGGSINAPRASVNTACENSRYPPSSLGMKKISQPSRIGWK